MRIVTPSAKQDASHCHVPQAMRTWMLWIWHIADSQAVGVEHWTRAGSQRGVSGN
ncbi:MAG: hypothetical protein Kow0074_22650 [Candidatus Zixiibacteriota bacterium]